MLKCVGYTFGNIYHPFLHRLRVNQMRKKRRKEISLRIQNENIVSKSLSRKKRIYADVTDVFFNDKGTGIQRVVKNISENLKVLTHTYDFIEVYYRDGKYFACENNNEIDFCRGDIFFLLDQPMSAIYECSDFFEALKAGGVKTVSFFFDLIPVTKPQFCDRGYVKDFNHFLRVVLNFSHLICDSSAVSDELKEYIKNTPKLKHNSDIKISYALLGSDFSILPRPLLTSQKKRDVKSEINFLMVSTVEPRKMYAQAVKAFDMLWKEGLSVNLWIVGRRGWKNETTFRLIEENTHYGKELVWYSTGISDEELASLYEKCDAVIFASVAEGFGLAVAEGAHFGKPLILRDIPVFREIAGNNAFYFSGTDESILAGKIKEWISLYKTSKEPKSTNIKLTSWKECSQKVLDLLTGNGEKS